jgi:hypothetical protein
MRGAVLLLAGGLVALLGLVFGLMLLGGQIAASCQASGVSAAGEPALVAYYLAAAQRYGLGPDGYAYLAAINHVETTFGTNMATSSQGAIGWMQFEPGTFVTYGVAVTNPGGQPDPYDPQDAIYSAANYLHASGAPGNWPAAIFSYNHAGWYVAEVRPWRPATPARASFRTWAPTFRRRGAPSSRRACRPRPRSRSSTRQPAPAGAARARQDQGPPTAHPRRRRVLWGASSWLTLWRRCRGRSR